MTLEEAAQSDTRPEARVFISYSRKDMAFAERLEGALQTRGIKPLIDRSEIYAFEDWWKRIEALITQADTIVMVLSPDAISSEVCMKEIAFAASLNKRFAPIVWRRVDDKMVPETLSRLNFIFFDDDTRFDESANRLAEALATDIDWIRKHTEFGEVAHRWSPDGRPGPRGLLLRSPRLDEAEHWIASRPQGAPVPTDTTQAFILDSRRGATRRRNMLTASLAAGLFLALGLSGFAYWQRGIAIEQRGIAKSEATRAERNFGAAKSTIDHVILDLAQGLQDVEGMRVETVRRILERAEVAVVELASKTENNPAVRRSQAVMFSVFSDTYFRLGATERAADYAQKATGIFRTLAAENPSNTGWQRDLSASLHYVGDVLLAQGNLSGALAAFREGFDIMRTLIAIDPSNMGWQSDLSLDTQSIGDVLVAAGDLAGAFNAYDAALDITRAIAAKDPDNTGWPRGVSVGLQRIGNVLVAQGNLVGALAAYREGLEISRALTAKDPDNTQWQDDVRLSFIMVGDVLVKQGDLTGALAAFRKSLDIQRALAAKDSGNARWRRGLSVSLERVGNVLRAQGVLPDALAAYREGLDISRALTTKDASNAEWRRDLSISLESVGNVLRAQGVLPGALAAYRECLDIRRELAAKSQGNAAWQMDVVFALHNLALSGDNPRARSSEALVILKQLNSQGLLTPENQGTITIIEGELAKLAQAERQ